jgi:hypothetical protein
MRTIGGNPKNPIQHNSNYARNLYIASRGGRGLYQDVQICLRSA